MRRDAASRTGQASRAASPPGPRKACRELHEFDKNGSPWAGEALRQAHWTIRFLSCNSRPAVPAPAARCWTGTPRRPERLNTNDLRCRFTIRPEPPRKDATSRSGCPASIQERETSVPRPRIFAETRPALPSRPTRCRHPSHFRPPDGARPRDLRSSPSARCSHRAVIRAPRRLASCAWHARRVIRPHAVRLRCGSRRATTCFATSPVRRACSSRHVWVASAPGAHALG